MPDDLDSRDPAELDPHEVNQEIYGDEELEDDFIQSIEDQGVIQPVVITEGDTVISGHRRVEAAKELGMNVPVRVTTFDSDLEEREAIVLSNKQRDKSFKQKMREADELMVLYSEDAEERMQEGTQNFAEGEVGETREKVAEVYDWSKEKLRQAQKVWWTAEGEIDASDDIQSLAQDKVEERENDETSVHAAHVAVKEAKEGDEAETEAESQITEESEVDEVEVTDDSQHWVETAPDTYSDLSSDLDLNDDWQESVRTLRNEWPSDEADEGALTYVLVYLLEKDGVVSLSGNPTDEGPISLVECRPGDEVLKLLRDEDETIGEFALQFSVHPVLVKLWLHEVDEGVGVESAETSKDPFATAVPAEEDE